MKEISNTIEYSTRTDLELAQKLLDTAGRSHLEAERTNSTSLSVAYDRAALELGLFALALIERASPSYLKKVFL